VNCDQTQELFSDYYDRALAEECRPQVEEHLRACVPCGEEYRHYKRGLDMLRTTSQMETSSIFATGVIAAAQTEALPPKARRPFAWPWIPAVAAFAVIAFLVGLLVRRPPEERVREIVREREIPGPAVERPLTRADKERLLREEFDLVHDGRRWMPREMKEGFEKGWVCLDGRMMARDDAFAKLSEGRPRRDDPVEVRPDMDREMSKLGYEKVGRTYVIREWLEAWTRGAIQIGPDTWVSREEFRSEFMREHNLVEYPEKSGIIMSREHRDELLAQRIVRRPDSATADNEVTSALAGLEIGPPSSYRALTLYPLLSPREPRDPEFVPLPGALEDGRIELADSGSPFEVRATNSGDRPVLLLEGEILAGGKYARIVAESSVIPPGKKAVAIPVYCVEPSGLRRDDRFTSDSGHYFGTYGLRKAILGEAGQGGAWAQCTRQSDLTGSKAKSQVEVYRHLLSELFEFRSFFVDLPERFPMSVGVVVCVGESVEAVELFPDREAFRAYFERILNAAALEACLRSRDLGTRSSGVPGSLSGVRKAIETAFSAKFDGRTLRIEGRPCGRALAPGGRLSHLLLFAEPAAGEPYWRASYKVPAEKLKKVLDEIERPAREGTAAARIRAIRELSFVDAREATVRVLRHLAEPDAALRRETIQALGRRGDPAAVPALLEILDKSKKEAGIHAAAASALARIGDERAVEPFLRQLEGDSGVVRTILGVLPEILLQLKTPEPLEKGVGRLVVLGEEAEAILKGVNPAGRWSGAEASTILTAVRTALEAVTGDSFETAARAREWWNKRENRERFLRERTGK